MSLNLSGITYRSDVTSMIIDHTNHPSCRLVMDCNGCSYLAHEVDSSGTSTLSSIKINNLPSVSSVSVNFVCSFLPSASDYSVSSSITCGDVSICKSNLSSDLVVTTGERLLLVGLVVNGVAFLNFQSYA